MKFRYPFPDKVERLPGDDFVPEGKSLTLQSEAEGCDINVIVSRYLKTGVLDHVRENQGMFLDLPPQLEYQDALGIVRASEQAFAVLPAEIRAQFNNSPQQFLQFADSNEDYLEKLGLAPGKESAAAESAEVVGAPVVPPPAQASEPVKK